jgi:hypothetical protein
VLENVGKRSIKDVDNNRRFDEDQSMNYIFGSGEAALKGGNDDPIPLGDESIKPRKTRKEKNDLVIAEFRANGSDNERDGEVGGEGGLGCFNNGADINGSISKGLKFERWGTENDGSHDDGVPDVSPVYHKRNNTENVRGCKEEKQIEEIDMNIVQRNGGGMLTRIEKRGERRRGDSNPRSVKFPRGEPYLQHLPDMLKRPKNRVHLHSLSTVNHSQLTPRADTPSPPTRCSAGHRVNVKNRDGGCSSTTLRMRVPTSHNLRICERDRFGYGLHNGFLIGGV